MHTKNENSEYMYSTVHTCTLYIMHVHVYALEMKVHIHIILVHIFSILLPLSPFSPSSSLSPSISSPPSLPFIPPLSLSLPHPLSLPLSSSFSLSVQFDGKYVVSGAYDFLVKVWNPIDASCIYTLQGHTNRVYSLLVSLTVYMYMYTVSNIE